VKFYTKRFRGNVMDAATEASVIPIDALSAAEADDRLHDGDV